jgi:hypothetical protein
MELRSYRRSSRIWLRGLRDILEIGDEWCEGMKREKKIPVLWQYETGQVAKDCISKMRNRRLKECRKAQNAQIWIYGYVYRS